MTDDPLAENPLAAINKITAERIERKHDLDAALRQAVNAGLSASDIARAFSPPISRQAAHKRIQQIREENKDELAKE
jgi:hypothetical protein